LRLLFRFVRYIRRRLVIRIVDSFSRGWRRRWHLSDAWLRYLIRARRRALRARTHAGRQNKNTVECRCAGATSTPLGQHVAADASQNDVERLSFGHALQLQGHWGTHDFVAVDDGRATHARPFREDLANGDILGVKCDAAVLKFELHLLGTRRNRAKQKHQACREEC
jgi:hypothetical protein